MFARRRSSSPSHSIALLACLLCVSAYLIGNVVSMSLDRLATDRSNENQMEYSETMMNSAAPQEEVDQSASSGGSSMSETNSDMTIDASDDDDDGTISVVPVKDGHSDVYLLVPAAGSPSQNEEDVLQSLSDHEVALDASSAEGLADMMMLESEDMPAMQILEVPQDIMETKFEEDINDIHENENEISNSETVAESDVVTDTMANALAETVQEIEKELETQLTDTEESASNDKLTQHDMPLAEMPVEHKDADMDSNPIIMQSEEVQLDPEQEMIGVVMEQESTQAPLESYDLKVDSQESVQLEDSEQILNDSAAEETEMTTELGDISQMVSESHSMDAEQNTSDMMQSEKLEMESEMPSEKLEEQQSVPSEDVTLDDDNGEPQVVSLESEDSAVNQSQDLEDTVVPAENDSAVEASQSEEIAVENNSAPAGEETQNDTEEEVKESTEAPVTSDESVSVPASQDHLTIQESLDAEESSTSKAEESSGADVSSILSDDTSNAEEIPSEETAGNAEQVSAILEDDETQHNVETATQIIDANNSAEIKPQSDETAAKEEMQLDQHAEETQLEEVTSNAIDNQQIAEESQPADQSQLTEESSTEYLSDSEMAEDVQSATETQVIEEMHTVEDSQSMSDDMEITSDDQHVAESEDVAMAEEPQSNQPMEVDEVVAQSADEVSKPAEDMQMSQTEEEANPSEELQMISTEEDKPSEELQMIHSEEDAKPSEEIHIIEESHSIEDAENVPQETVEEVQGVEEEKNTPEVVKPIQEIETLEESQPQEEAKPSEESQADMTVEALQTLEDSQPMEETQAAEELHAIEEILADELSQTAEEESKPIEESQTVEHSQFAAEAAQSHEESAHSEESAPIEGLQIAVDTDEAVQSLENTHVIDEVEPVVEIEEVHNMETSHDSDESAQPSETSEDAVQHSEETQSVDISSEPMTEAQIVKEQELPAATPETQQDEQLHTMEEISTLAGSSESQLMSDEIEVAKEQTSSVAIEEQPMEIMSQETQKVEDDAASAALNDDESQLTNEESQQNTNDEQLTADNKDDPILNDDTDNTLIPQEQQAADKPQEPSMLTTILQVPAPMPESEMQQQPTVKPLNVMDSVLNYVNASFMNQQPMLQQQDEELDQDAVPFSSKLRRYDGAQVWRIVVQNDRERKMADELQSKYDGQLWKEVKQEVDYLLKPQVLADAERHVRAANLSRIVLIDNLQKVIDVENPPPEKIAELQDRNGHRLTWEAYHRLKDIHGFYGYLATAYPELCSVETIGYSIEKRPLKVLKISNGNANNPSIWIDGGMHAREWIGVAVVTYIANQIAEGWDDLPAHMRNVNWYIHAVANPDGYEYSHTTDRLWRKNMRSHGRACPGVDLNRNFGYKWGGKGTSANPCSQTYRGSKAFSEPETFYISKFISNFPRDTFKGFLSFHSYGQYILYPWGYDYHITKDMADLDLVARQAGTSITRSSGVKYTVGSSAHTLYPAAGGSDDWAKGFADIKYSYTIEMGDTGRYGFVLPASHIEPNGKDGYIFVQTVARAITMGKNGRRRKLVAKSH